jgi:hypothetical protein
MNIAKIHAKGRLVSFQCSLEFRDGRADGKTVRQRHSLNPELRTDGRLDRCTPETHNKQLHSSDPEINASQQLHGFYRTEYSLCQRLIQLNQFTPSSLPTPATAQYAEIMPHPSLHKLHKRHRWRNNHHAKADARHGGSPGFAVR